MLSLNHRMAYVLGFILLWNGFGSAQAQLIPLEPDSVCQTDQRGGVTVWQTMEVVKFKLPKQATALEGKPLYVRVRYFDEGRGRIQLAYTTAMSRWTDSENHTRSSRINTLELVDSYHELKSPAANPGGSFVRIRILNPNGIPLSITSVTAQRQPFEDSLFRQVIAEPWKKALSFPPDDRAPKTLKGTIMVGYQGWFRTPNDLYDKGVRHWLSPATSTQSATYTVDMWPDLSAYPQSAWSPVEGLKTQGGKQAYLFSSANVDVVNQHFRWMREYKIDGAFVQRFLSHRAGGDDGTAEWVLYAVRQAANSEKRLWAIEYDVSGLSNENALAVLSKDWKWLVDVLKVTGDPYYARENGKPVVFIWGLSVPGRGFTPDVADEVVKFFKDDAAYGNNYVIGGIPAQWRKLDQWQRHVRLYDAVLTWQGKQYGEDRKDLQQLGVRYYPHVWPGFSWAHLKQAPEQYTPRDGGQFYWSLITRALQTENDWLFVGMFDEYDEGTAIIPMSDDPPAPTPITGRFLTNEQKPAIWWMQLTAYAKEILEGKRKPIEPMPLP